MKAWLLMTLFSATVMAQTDLTIAGKTLSLSTTTANVQSAHLITSAQPSADDLKQLAGAGVSVVIDLRGTQEDRGYNEAELSQQLGLRYIAMPINGAGEVTSVNAQKLDEILKTVGEATVLLHCASSNRVGALLALRAQQQGAGVDQALSLGKANGLKSLEPVVKSQIEAGASNVKN